MSMPDDITRDELLVVLIKAVLAINVTLSIITPNGIKLLTLTDVIMPTEDPANWGDLDSVSSFNFIRHIGLTGDPEDEDTEMDVAETIRLSESSFMIPPSSQIASIQRVEAAGEETVAVDADHVYYVVTTDGVTMRIEI